MSDDNKPLLDEMFHGETPKDDDFNIVFVLDRSGSMGFIWDSVISGTNKFIEEQKKEGGNAYFSLVQFDDTYGDPQYWLRPIAKVELLTKENFIPRGMTALLDAIGKTAAKVRELRADGKVKGKVQFVIQTDGHENNSTEFTTRNQVAEIIKEIREEGWGDFIFLGANIDSFGEGRTLGIPRGTTVQYDCNGKSVQGASLFASVNTKAFRYGTVLSKEDITEMQDKVAHGIDINEVYGRIDASHVRGEKKDSTET